MKIDEAVILVFNLTAGHTLTAADEAALRMVMEQRDGLIRIVRELTKPAPRDRGKAGRIQTGSGA